MKRWLWAVAAALAVQTAAHAEYVIIRVLLNPSGSAATPTGQQPGFPGGPGTGMGGGGALGIGGGGPGGRPGFPGGPGGGPPGGMIGIPGGGPPGGMIGISGGPGGGPPGIGMGGGGRPGFPGGPGGGGPGIGMGGGGPGGRPGFPGGPSGGGPPGGGMGGFGAFGFSGGGQPGMGMTGGQPTGPNPNAKYNLGADEYVTVVVETKGGGVHQIPYQNFRQEIIGGRGDIKHLSMNHIWGTTFLDVNADGIVLDLNTLPSPKQQLANRQKLSKDHSPDKSVELAEWCLTVGLPDDCIAIMDKLATNEKALATPRIKTILDAFAKAREVVTGTVSKTDKAKAWQERVGYAVLSVSKHYAIVHTEGMQDSATRRLEFLEDNLKTFYLWFAFRGRALPAPTEKLPAVLVADTTEFRKYRDAFEATDLVADGFHARRENLAIFSGRRLDKASVNFEQVLKEVYRKYKVNDLFNKKLPDAREKTGDKYTAYARSSTLALVDNALQRESEIASATHEGTQQLFAETGLLPRTVIAPEWVRFGLGSLFEMPKGPFPGGAGKVKVAFYRGGGGPNWAYMRYYEEMRDQGLLKNAISDFVATVTDTYFHAAKVTNKEDANVDGESRQSASEKLAAKARTFSWSLTYFLAKQRYPQFEKFLQELAKLPRDAELDEEATITALSKAFGYSTAGISGADSADKRFAIIAIDWKNWMEGQQSPSRQLKVDTLILQGGPGTGAAPAPGAGGPGGGPGGGNGGDGGGDS